MLQAIFVICVFFSSWLFSAHQNIGAGFKKYNLVNELPDILISTKAEQIGATWSNGGVYDKPLINSFYKILSAKKDLFVVLDIGAQTGCFTLLSKFLPNSQWYAFEPIQEAADVLKDNLRLNNIRNVSVYQVAVSDRAGSALLKLPTDNHWGLTTLGETPLRFNKYNIRTVECIELDSFVSKQKIDKVDFIKIDTEGWELHVLMGGREMIARDKPIILMEFNTANMAQCNVNPDEIIAFLQELGYEWEFVSAEDLLCIPKT